ncbi:hypothetical protein L1987_13115 [Smallanthus sonchifolius]|uniref:Uncharacterized protein n=1 Tax=Smallanthus sonchifolius TaxID=185202 RepID=A0ACB9JGH7_9ASTR|nr:hypothetical protein L1987_13115 [Smallanthus sonchifolius]
MAITLWLSGPLIPGEGSFRVLNAVCDRHHQQSVAAKHSVISGSISALGKGATVNVFERLGFITIFSEPTIRSMNR